MSAQDLSTTVHTGEYGDESRTCQPKISPLQSTLVSMVMSCYDSQTWTKSRLGNRSYVVAGPRVWSGVVLSSVRLVDT